MRLRTRLWIIELAASAGVGAAIGVVIYMCRVIWKG